MYDAIIVGARAAGASTALLLARRGYRVLLVDRASFPSDTISGHFILHAGVRQLASWGLLEPLIATGCPPITHATSDYGDGVLSADIPTEDGLPACIGPRRIVLDALLVEAACAAGAELRTGVVVDGLLTNGEQVTGIHGHTAQGTSVAERAQIVIGADGKRSMVADLVQAPHYLEQPSMTCWYMSYWKGLPSDGIEMYWRPGRLAFAFPTHDQLTLLAVAWPHHEFAQFRSDIAGNVRATVALMPALEPRFASAQQVGRFLGMADLPNFFRQPYGPGWALVGDAGHHKDPTLARGLSDAFCDAELLAKAVDLGLSGYLPLSDALAAYEQERNGRAIPENKANLQAAYLQGWDEPESTRLRASLRSDPEGAGRYYAERLQVF
jgi:flavin-dependent dehydrogenase